GELGTFARPGRDSSIEARRSLEDHERTALTGGGQEWLIQAHGGGVPDSCLHLDAVRAQHRKSASPPERIRVLHRRHYATDAGSNDSLGAGSGLAGVNARFKRAVQRRATRAASRFF